MGTGSGWEKAVDIISNYYITNDRTVIHNVIDIQKTYF